MKTTKFQKAVFNTKERSAKAQILTFVGTAFLSLVQTNIPHALFLPTELVLEKVSLENNYLLKQCLKLLGNLFLYLNHIES